MPGFIKAPKTFRLRTLELSERDVAAQIKAFLGAHNWVVVRNHVGAFVPLRVAKEANRLALAGHGMEAVFLVEKNIHQMCEEGTSDFLAVHPVHRSIWIEVKRHKKKPRPTQADWLAQKARDGFLAGCWDSIDSFREFYRETFP